MILLALLMFVPISLVLAYWVHPSPIWIFVTGALAIVPLADRIRRATDSVASRAGSSIGGLVNVTFGSAVELILALFVLAAGHADVVKAQITGSIVGTSLLGLGIAVIAGGWSREKQVFKRERAGLLSSLLILSVIALMIPALFDYAEHHGFANPNAGGLDEKLSLGVSVVLIAVYVANLVYTLVTHRDVFASRNPEETVPKQQLWKTLAILIGTTIVVAVEAHLVSESLQATANQLGLTPLFLGVIVLALIGNAAEIIAAVYFARQDRMGLVMGICIGSTVQVALLVAPALVLISFFMGHPMNLVFSNPLELIAIVGAVFAVNSIAADGETTWFEGVLLVSVYCLVGLAFFFATP